MRIVRLLAAALVATVLAVLTAGAARAHNSLTGATPAKNATLDESPGGVELTFLQKVDPAALTITVTDAGQRAVPAGPPRADGKTGSITFPEPLPNGVYTVTYRVVSQDGHPVRGSYRFTVADPAAAQASPEAESPAAAPEASPSEASSPEAASSVAARPVPVATSADDSGWPVAAGVAAAVVVLAAVAALLVRRRRTT